MIMKSLYDKESDTLESRKKNIVYDGADFL